MIKKVIILGSRNLCVEVIKIFHFDPRFKLQGVMAPEFVGWWKDPVRNYCQASNIPLIHDLKEVSENKPDLIFSVNYWKILPAEIFESFVTLNIHHSYRLRFKGRYSTTFAIMKAREDNYWIHGSSIHRVAKELDNGELYFTTKVEISPDDTSQSLFHKVEKACIHMLKDNLTKIYQENFLPIEKDYKSYLISKTDLNHDLSAINNLLEFKDNIRALSFKNAPAPFFHIGNKKYIITVSDENN